MAAQDAQVRKRVAKRGTEMTQLDEVAETIRDDALEWAVSCLGALQRGLELGALLKRSDFVDRFNYGIAKGVARTIAAHDQRVQSVHIYDASGNPEHEAGMMPSLDASIHLLAVVEKPSAALEAFIAALDRALVASLQLLSSDLYSRRTWILDLKLITQQEIEDNRGFACLLNSTFTPALQIWGRNA